MVRPPTPQEAALLEKLTEPDFPGSLEIREQLRGIQVREIDEDGSLELVGVSGSDAIVNNRIPIEGEMVDSDGTVVHVLLHVVNGRVNELEIYKDDGSRVLEPVDHERMTVLPWATSS
jgi:hypothetical protein